MARNLSRSTKLFVSTVASSHTTANTFEIPPLDGYSFSQDTASQDITLSEAGNTPVRAQQSFNTAVNPAEVSFTTYIRPYKSGGNHNCVERLLWEAFIGTGGSPFSNTISDATDLSVTFSNSDKPQLLKLYLYFVLDNVTYVINEFVVNTAEVDFSIDGISQISWSGQGKSISESTLSFSSSNATLSTTLGAEFIRNKLNVISLTDNTTSTPTNASVVVDTGGVAGTATVPILTVVEDLTVDYTGGFIKIITATNHSAGDTFKITASSIGGGAGADTLTLDVPSGVLFTATDDFEVYSSISAHAGKTYNIPITGGSMTLDNGITFLTAEELGVVNQPIDHFTGTRAISGSLTAYLSTGQQNTADLLNMLANDLTNVAQSFTLRVGVGATSTNSVGGGTTPRMELNMTKAHLTIPTIATEDVISTEITFTAQNPNGLDPVSGNEEIAISYVAT